MSGVGVKRVQELREEMVSTELQTGRGIVVVVIMGWLRWRVEGRRFLG